MGYNFTYPVATVTNASFMDVVNALEVSYASLQSMTGNQLRIELLKLYDNLPTDAVINLKIYNDAGLLVKSVDERQDEINYEYDEFNRVIYVTDKSDKVTVAKKYNYKPQ